MSTAFETDDSVLNPTLRGHLAIEALLVELIMTVNNDDRVWRWGFPDKTKFAVQQNLLPDHIKVALDKFNDFRNDIAHIFGFRIGGSDIHSLARDLERLGVDFSDSVGQQPIDEARESYGGDAGILREILWCLAYEVAQALAVKGGRDIFAPDET